VERFQGVTTYISKVINPSVNRTEISTQNEKTRSSNIDEEALPSEVLTTGHIAHLTTCLRPTGQSPFISGPNLENKFENSKAVGLKHKGSE
jgi:hypothetical protein